MNAKPLVGLNHFTVPLAITSSPRDQKIKRIAGPRTPARPTIRGYAVCAVLDSSNGTLILTKIDLVCGTFTPLSHFRSFLRSNAIQMTTSASPRTRTHATGFVHFLNDLGRLGSRI